MAIKPPNCSRKRQARCPVEIALFSFASLIAMRPSVINRHSSANIRWSFFTLSMFIQTGNHARSTPIQPLASSVLSLARRGIGYAGSVIERVGRPIGQTMLTRRHRPFCIRCGGQLAPLRIRFRDGSLLQVFTCCWMSPRMRPQKCACSGSCANTTRWRPLSRSSPQFFNSQPIAITLNTFTSEAGGSEPAGSLSPLAA